MIYRTLAKREVLQVMPPSTLETPTPTPPASPSLICHTLSKQIGICLKPKWNTYL